MISVYLFVGLFALLANGIPEVLWRSDKRSPSEIAQAGGFISRALSNGYNPDDYCTLEDHQSQSSANDPFISTSGSAKASLKFLSLPPKIHSGYLYQIDTRKAQALGVVFHNCKQTGMHQSEQEFAAFEKIPLDAILLCTEYKNQKAAGKARPIPKCKHLHLQGNKIGESCDRTKRDLTGLQKRDCGGTKGAPLNRAQRRKLDAERRKTEQKAAAAAAGQGRGQGQGQGQVASTQQTAAFKQTAPKKSQHDAQLRQTRASRASTTFGTTTNKKKGKGGK